MLTTVIGAALILDCGLFVAKRRVIEPRVRCTFPRLNCGALAAAEFIVGAVLVFSALA